MQERVRRTPCPNTPVLQPKIRKRKKKQAENLKSESDSADLSDDGRTYGIDHLNLGESENDSDSEY